MNSRAAEILIFLERTADFVIERESARRNLGTVVGHHFTELLARFLDQLLPIAQSLDAPVREIVAAVGDRATTDSICRCFERISEDQTYTAQRIGNFAEAIRAVVPFLEPPPWLAQKLLDFLVFTRAPHVAKRVGKVLWLVEKVPRAQPDIFRSYIAVNFERIVMANFSALVMCLEMLGDKMSIVDALPKAVDRKQFFTIDDLVRKTFACNNGEIHCAGELLTMLGSPQLGEAA
jgi:hypothetical protein